MDWSRDVLKRLILLSLSFFLKVQPERTDSEFPKTFSGVYLFVVVKYLCNRSPKMRTKKIQNYNLILAIISYQNWLDAFPPITNKSLKSIINLKYKLLEEICVKDRFRARELALILLIYIIIIYKAIKGYPE